MTTSPLDSPPTAPLLRLDLGLLPAADRFPFWHDEGSRILRPLATDPPTPPAVTCDVLQLGPVTLAQMEASPLSYERTAEMIRRDGADILWLVLLERGTMHHDVDGSELEITDGDLILLDAARASRSRWSAHRQLFASFPREVIEPFSAPALIPGRLPANHACGRLLAAHLRGLWTEGLRAEADVRSAMGQGLIGLTRASFSSASLVQSHGDQDASGQALLASTIRRWMFSQLHRQDLDAATVAAQFHLSRSSLYRLFEPWGGVRCVLQEQRLRVAVERLPQHQGSMAVLANDLGFASASAFSHAFRSRWGVPPREWQHRSTGRDQRPNSNPKADGRRDGPSPRQQELDTFCSTYYHQLKG